MDLYRQTNAQNPKKSGDRNSVSRLLLAVAALCLVIPAVAQNPIPMVTSPLVPGQKNPLSPPLPSL